MLKINWKLKGSALAAMMAIPLCANAMQGADGSGGGNVIVKNGCSLLLDLYLANPTAAGSTCQPGVQLPESKALRSIHMDRLNSKDSVIVSQAIQKLNAWKSRSPVVTGLIQEALTGAPLYFTNYEIGIQDKHYSIPKEFEDRVLPQDLKTIAFYSKNFGILVSKTDFNQLNEKNQVAVLVHESLRHVSIQYDFHMSDSSIQKITGAIVLGEPGETECLDTQDYVDGELLKKIQAQGQRTQQLISRTCEAALPYKSQMIEMDREQFDQVCTNSNLLPLGELSVALRDIAGSLIDFSRSAFLVALNAANDENTLAIGDITDHTGPSVRELTDAVMNAQHSMGLDAAIDQANRGLGWLTGSKWQVLDALSELVDAGVLKE